MELLAVLTKCLRGKETKLMRKLALGVFGLAVGSMFAVGSVGAQSVDNTTLLHPPADSWPSYHGDYSGKRHSPLTQITPKNVTGLSLAWAFQTGQTAGIKASPILSDGVIYFTVPDNLWAIDALTGHLLWHYKYPPNTGDHIGNRGVAVFKGKVYFMGPDAHMVCLNGSDGTVLWNIAVADSKKGYWTTEAPLIVGNHVIAGVGGDMDNLPMFLQAFDPQTGALQWKWDVNPPAGSPNYSTGGTTWMPGTYDPELNLLYWGTGNPTPVLNGKARPGEQ